jgi:predicted metal-binding protein
VADRNEIEALFAKFGFSDFQWIDPKSISVSEWVRMKCRYGCVLYANRAGCPPNIPPVAECRNFIHEYSEAAIVHFQMQISEAVDCTNNPVLNKWYRKVNLQIFELEREIFFLDYEKVFAFAIGPCVFCAECKKQKENCVNPIKARPTPESFGVEVFTLARKHGFPIQALRKYDQPINSFSLLLLE